MRLLWAPEAPSCWGPAEEPRLILPTLSNKQMQKLGYLYAPHPRWLRATPVGRVSCQPFQFALHLGWTSPRCLKEHSDPEREAPAWEGTNCLSQLLVKPEEATGRWAGYITTSFSLSDLQEFSVFSKYFWVSYLPLCHLQSIACLFTLFIVSEIFNSITINSISCLLYGFHFLAS